MFMDVLIISAHVLLFELHKLNGFAARLAYLSRIYVKLNALNKRITRKVALDSTSRNGNSLFSELNEFMEEMEC